MHFLQLVVTVVVPRQHTALTQVYPVAHALFGHGPKPRVPSVQTNITALANIFQRIWVDDYLG